MRRPGRCLLALYAVAASIVATAASAADLPAPGPAAAYPPVYRPVIYDWTGIYFGGHVGGGWMNDTVTTTTTTLLEPVGTATKVAPMGVLGGAQVGFNIEFAPVVIGFEGTWTATSLSGTQGTASPLAPGGFSESSTSAAPYLATAAGRIGYAANDFLFYAKGGAAWMRVDYTQGVTSGTGLNSQQTLNDTRTGFLAGGGVEFGITENLSAKVEYDFLGFGTKSYNFTNLGFVLPGAPPGTTPTPIGPVPVSVKSTLQMVTFGVNYRFNWGGGGPVVAAKY